MRFRITVRGDDPKVELRGYVDGDEALIEMCHGLESVFGTLVMVMASPADDDYDPFKEWNQ